MPLPQSAPFFAAGGSGWMVDAATMNPSAAIMIAFYSEFWSAYLTDFIRKSYKDTSLESYLLIVIHWLETIFEFLVTESYSYSRT